jgi:iron(III) transport system ATP-binding protein
MSVERAKARETPDMSAGENAGNASPGITISGLVKQFANADDAAVNDVSLDIPSGSFFTLLGPSGCGKSTTLRCLAGLERPDSGEIRFGDRVVFSDRERVNVPTYRRRIGMVFQSYAIWPHMTVLQNVEYPLHNVPRPQRKSRAEIAEQAMSALSLVSMDHLAKRSAPLLSGGEQQRVALARALVQDPDVLLLDEPLSNLDAKLRDQMRHELRDLQAKVRVTTIYVTHDQDEAFSLSDQMAVMSKGKVMEVGQPTDIYRVSRTAFGAEFLGTASKVPGRVVRATQPGMAVVSTAIGDVVCRVSTDMAPGAAVVVYVRPEEVWPHTAGEARDSFEATIVRARVTRITFLGGTTEWLAESNGVVLKGRSFSFSDASTFMTSNLEAEVDLRIAAVRCLPVEDTTAALMDEEEAPASEQ